jgi:hypothetical protein
MLSIAVVISLILEDIKSDIALRRALIPFSKVETVLPIYWNA